MQFDLVKYSNWTKITGYPINSCCGHSVWSHGQEMPLCRSAALAEEDHFLFFPVVKRYDCFFDVRPNLSNGRWWRCRRRKGQWEWIPKHDKKHNLLKLLKRRNCSYKTSRFSGIPWSPAQVSFLRCDQSILSFYEQVCLLLCDWLVCCGRASGFLSTHMRKAFNLQKDHA